jgi:hypothetical protein
MKIGDIVAIKDFCTPNQPCLLKGMVEHITTEKTIIKIDDNFRLTYTNPIEWYHLEPINCSIGKSWQRYTNLYTMLGHSKYDTYNQKIFPNK